MSMEYIGFEKQLKIIDLLLAGEILNTHNIVKIFNVNRRTALRYMNRIADFNYELSNIDIKFNRGKGAGSYESNPSKIWVEKHDKNIQM